MSNDQQKLVENEISPSSYNDMLSQNSALTTSDSYGTFVGEFPTTTTNQYSNIGPVVTNYSASSQMMPNTNVITIGTCPVCKTGTLDTDFTCVGISCAVFLFPIGLICCWAFRQRRCSFCGAIF